MNQARVPASVLISLAFHAGFLVLFMGLVKEGPKQAAQIVEGVDLLIAPARPRPVEGTPKPAISTMDFLKMALPAAPRRAELAAVDVKLPETRKPLLAEAPRLEESTALTTREVVVRFARYLRLRGVLARAVEPYHHEKEVEDFLRIRKEFLLYA